MSEDEKVVKRETLWSVAVQADEGGPFVRFGSHNSDAAAVLRTYDFRSEKHPEETYAIEKTTVTVELVDAEELRKMVEEASAAKEGRALQSE